MIAWDCDADKFRNLVQSNNTYPFVFSRNELNTVARKGIENLFESTLLDRFKKEIHFSDGTVKVEFDENQKGAFAQFVLDRRNPADFELFQSLVKFVGALIQSDSAFSPNEAAVS